jgi:hypothetical protein
MADQNPQKQIVDKLKDVESILVTVNTNPTVDELSAALGFTLLLNKLDKHATAVFSGAIPPAITFLEPQKTFEDTVNSLRDFIIALDKEKADHLRYKVDGDMVKIFITPYRTTISQDDLDFSQGDYNVEMVVAIGVKDEADLDRALADHGKIMHDATVASLSVGSESSELGSINWHDSEASSYSEMLVSISEALKADKNLIDEQIATAFLTGIVAATERFSNNQTTSKVMTMAAQLMAAGANQQLIATQLEAVEEIPEAEPTPEPQPAAAPADTQPAAQVSQKEEAPKDTPAADGSMQISHEKSGSLDDVAAQTEKEHQDEAAQKATEALEQQTAEHSLANGLNAGASVPTLDDLKNDLEAAKNETDDVASPAPAGPDMSLPTPGQQFEPTMGGTLNATTEEAAADKIREELSDRNKQILSHDHGTQYVGNPPATLPALNSFSDKAQGPQPASLMEGDQQATMHAPALQPLSYESAPAAEEPAPMLPPAPVFDTPSAGPTLAELDAQNRQPHDEARAAIEDALKAGPSTEVQQASVETTPPTPPEATTAFDAAEPSLPPLPPMPDFSTLPPLPGATMPDQGMPQPPVDQNFMPPTASSEGLDAAFPPLPPTQPGPDSSQPADPNQFQIPGQ